MPPRSTLLSTAWLMVVLLMPVALLNYLDRQMLATMKMSVTADIDFAVKLDASFVGKVLSLVRDLFDIQSTEGVNANWGFMLGQFKWVYAFLSPIGGYVADRFSRRFTICASLFVWSAVTWWTGHVTTLNELIWARSLMGFSEAFYIPAALALIADSHLGTTRSRAVGFHQLAIYCGQIVGGFGGYVAADPDLGWRLAFTTCGIVGMVYALPLVLLLRDAPRANDVVVTPKPSPIRAATELFTSVSFILLVLYFTLPALAAWVIRDWMPSILKDRFNIPQGQAGVYATLPWQLAAIVGAVVGGWLADYWMRRHTRGRIFISAIGMSLLVPALFGVGNANQLLVAVLFLMLFGIGWGFFDCNNMPILAQIVRPELRATGYGVMNFVSISCGGLADWGFGILQDQGVPLNIIFSVFASIAIFSIVLVLLIRPKPQLTTDAGVQERR